MPAGTTAAGPAPGYATVQSGSYGGWAPRTMAPGYPVNPSMGATPAGATAEAPQPRSAIETRASQKQDKRVDVLDPYLFLSPSIFF